MASERAAAGSGGPTALTPGGSKEMTLGVMGGGQLGRMFAHAAQQMGFFTAVLDPDTTSPAGRISHHHVQTAYTDAEGLARLAAVSAAITTVLANKGLAQARAYDSIDNAPEERERVFSRFYRVPGSEAAGRVTPELGLVVPPFGPPLKAAAAPPSSTP